VSYSVEPGYRGYDRGSRGEPESLRAFRERDLAYNAWREVAWGAYMDSRGDLMDMLDGSLDSAADYDPEMFDDLRDETGQETLDRFNDTFDELFDAMFPDSYY